MTNLEEHSDDEILILRVLAGEADTAEIHIFIEKCVDNTIFQNMYLEMKEMWESSHALVTIQNIDVDEAVAKFMARVDNAEETKKRPRRLIVWLTSTAAILILGLIFSGIFFKNKQVEVFASNSIINITLSDNSLVSLNRNARFTYPEHFSGTNREVSLTGEAYFKVQENKAHPFVIKTNKACIKVLGTSFNVNSSNLNVIVSVNSGRVLLYLQHNEAKQIALVMGETGRLSAIDQTLSKQVNPDPNFNSWATGILTFDRTPLCEAATILGQYYKTKFTFEDKDSGNCRLTAVFDHQPLDSVLKILELTFGIKVIKQGSIVIISGGCEKK